MIVYVKVTVDGAEEIIKLLDEASNLIKRLREITLQLGVSQCAFAELRSAADEIKGEAHHES